MGARTEELRALTRDHVGLDGRPGDDPPVPPSIQVWRSVREHGHIKTKKSRRTLGGVSLEEIAELCGHAGTRVTEAVYRHQLRPVLLNGAVAMDRIFASDAVASES